MTAYAALLRAVNVGGTGKLTMRDLATLCERAGCKHVRTYIQSGNVVFTSRLSEARLKATLEKALAAKMGKAVRVLVRTDQELDSIVARNPYATAPPNRVQVLFLDRAPARGALDGLLIPGREALTLDGRELFIHYPDGMGKSKLKLPLAEVGTGRNMNTVAKLAHMLKEL